MKKSFSTNLAALKKLLSDFENSEHKLQVLTTLSDCKLPENKQLIDYHDCLLFLVAHPQNQLLLKLAEAELKRITARLKIPKIGSIPAFADSGLPYTEMITRYSHDLLQSMMQSGYSLKLDSFEDGATELNDLLKITLPSILRDETTAGLDNFELLNRLKIKQNLRLNFLMQQFETLNNQPYLKDQLWQSMKPFVAIRFDNVKHSRTYNRFLTKPVYFQKELVKKFDHQTLLQTKLPAPTKLTSKQISELCGTIRNSMIQTLRETDTSTYMQESSLRYFELERGISIAIYGMTPLRQLPLQSYIGYTLFKNGFPTAYGGSWIYGQSAKFGLNVFEAFRGGESGLIMCELLRVYIQTFNLNYVEIDAFQFGKDNMDGIRSGAYWFYYRYGFRSLDSKLKKLAEAEYQKIKTKPGYRTSEKILIELAESNIALNLGNGKPFEVEWVSTEVINLISKKFNGDMIRAVEICKQNFIQSTGIKTKIDSFEETVLEEVALFSAAKNIKDKNKLDLLRQMISVKSKSPYQYNELVIAYRK